MKASEQALSTGMVRLADKQPKDGERVRVKIAETGDVWEGEFRSRLPDLGNLAGWLTSMLGASVMFLADDADTWEPMGASDE